jgi:hypothetical protein
MTSHDGDPDAISLTEASHLLGLGQLRVTRLQREGLLTRLPGQPSYSRADVLAFADNPWVTDIEAAFALGVSRRRAHQLAEAGEILSRRMSNGDLVLRLDRAPRPVTRSGAPAEDPYELLARSLRAHWSEGVTTDGDAEHLTTTLAQHLSAFRELVALALRQDSGVLTPLVLLSAHGVCRAGLEAAWAAHTGSAPRDGQDLEHLWIGLQDLGGLRHLDVHDIAHDREVVRRVLELAPDGRSTRHPSLGPRPRSSAARRLDVGELRDAVHAFLGHLEPR